jgi:hypothetical protein
VLGTQQSSNQGTQAGQSLPRPLSYKPRVWKTAILISPLPSTTLNIKNPQPFPFYVLSETKKRAKSLNIQIPLPKVWFFFPENQTKITAGHKIESVSWLLMLNWQFYLRLDSLGNTKSPQDV